MFAKNHNNTNLRPLPQEWQASLVKTLNQIYDDKIKRDDSSFFVFGQIFDEEVLIIISYIYNDLSKSPKTIFISKELNDLGKSSQMNIKKLFDNIVDFSGLILDEILLSTDWSEYEINWQEYTFSQEKFYYKITRENVLLTLQAEKIIGGE